MSDLVPTITPLISGLDLKSPTIMAEPGSMLACLNYEVAEQDGYKRIEGFVPYDGNVTLKDFEGAKYWQREIEFVEGEESSLPASAQFINNSDGDIIGWCLGITQEDEEAPILMRFISFLGNPNISGILADDGGVFFAVVDAGLTEITITNDELNTLETAVRDLVAPNTEDSIAVGLHWHRDHLYGVFPLVCISYTCDSPVAVSPGSALLSTLPDFMNAIVLDKIVTNADSGEVGYFICLQTGTGEFEADASSTYVLSGGVDGTPDTIYHQPGSLKGITSFAAHLWKATRQNPYVSSQFEDGGGWQPLTFTYAVRGDIDVSSASVTLNPVKRGYKPEDATRLRFGGAVETILEDYFVVDGDPYETSSRVVLQVAPASELALVPFSVLATEQTVEIYVDGDTPTWEDIGDTVAYPRLVFLPGVMEGIEKISYLETVDTAESTVEESEIVGLSYRPSRYTWKSANFFATESTDAFYGCSGAGRAVACTPYTLPGSDYAGTYSWIYTQIDEIKDRPSHVENHNQHLLLGFSPGSVQSSVIGLPTNFAGIEGASEIGVGDKVTGLLALSGSTTAIFCESSIWSLQGQNIDNFNTQVLSPNVGAIEYTVANCGLPIFLNQYGVSTLEQSSAYGDFEASSISQIVSPWLVPRCRLPYPNADFYEGVSGAIPVRKKNQYRVFFNDGEVLSVTLTPRGPVFTRQIYQVPVEQQVDNKLQRLIPIAWTSQVDSTGRERIIVSHYDKRVVYEPEVET